MANDRILIIDDDPNLRDVLRRYLLLNNYTVDEEGEGQAGYSRLKQGGYAACLLDINIPGMNGIDILAKVREDAEFNTPIVMMTGQTDVTTIVEVMRLGAEDYLQKPFNLAEMKISIDRACRIWAIKIENFRYKNFLEEEVARKTEGIRQSYFDVVRAFASSIEMRDPNTGGHTKRVSEISVMISAALGFEDEKLAEVRVGGILHDIGKIGIPDTVLQKPGLLTTEEHLQMQRHPVIGREIVKNIVTMSNMVPYILYHHERFDGKGYPEGLAGDAIPVEGRIVALADAFDAMVSDRVYRPRKTLDEAFAEILRHSGSQFDPAIVTVFQDLWRRQAIHQIVGE